MTVDRHLFIVYVFGVDTNSKPGNYFNKCELEFREVRKQVEALMNETTYSLMLGWQYPSCDLDGTYAPVQQNKTQ